jgi:dihydrofolate reductase
MRPVVYFVATTLDGFIAREDGAFDAFPWDDEYGAELFASFPETIPVHIRGGGHERKDNRWFDTVLMGRETYEVGLREGISSPYPTLDQYVISSTMSESPHDAVTLVRERATDVVNALRSESGKGIWLCGGAALATSLLSAGLIDELILKMNPVVFGRGIPLFRQPVAPVRWRLSQSKTFSSGHARLHYARLS